MCPQYGLHNPHAQSPSVQNLSTQHPSIQWAETHLSKESSSNIHKPQAALPLNQQLGAEA